MTVKEAIDCIDIVLSADVNYDESINFTLFSFDKEWLEKAKEALELTEKKKPNVLDVYEKSYDLECPNCGAGNFHLMYDDNVADHFDFCAHCGQALDWSDVE